jgi:hypothetical protein
MSFPPSPPPPAPLWANVGSWRETSEPPPPPPPPPAEPRPWDPPEWFIWLTFPIWIVPALAWGVLTDFFRVSPPGVDMRMNDPMWVLYDSYGRVKRGQPSDRNYWGASHGTDSDGSGMS